MLPRFSLMAIMTSTTILSGVFWIATYQEINHSFTKKSPGHVLGIVDDRQGITTTINWSNPGDGSGWFEYGVSRKYGNKYQFSSGQTSFSLSGLVSHQKYYIRFHYFINDVEHTQEYEFFAK